MVGFRRLQALLLNRLARWRHGVTLGVRAAVLDSDGRIFLVRHRYTPGWYFPGGGVDSRESAVAAVGREVMEEAGIRLDGPPDLFGLYVNRKLGSRDHVALFVCRSWTAEAPPYPNLEIAEGGFFDRDALPKGVTEATLRRLAEILDRQPRSEEW